MVERSIEMIVCIIAILKAGGAYLPIDTEYPESRVSYMLKDSKAKLLLANKKLEHNIQFQCQVIYIEDKEIYSENTINLNSSINRENLAYVIYTSGTTGRPKGVMVEHKGIINLKHWYEKKLGIGKDERILQFASVAFDAFSWELYMALLLGNTLCIPTKDIIMNSDLLNKYLADTNITTLTVPPFIASDIKPSIFLRRLITAGSEVKIEQVKNLLDKIEVINAYGPTEDTICTTYYRVKDTNIKIGKPIDNHSVLILDNHNELLPIGIPGELCVSGDGLARGYLNNEELTNKKFM
jgi:amino acid adenylation domain-containing protein